MCGICGIYDLKQDTRNKTQETKKIIQKMTDTLIHRGPDDEGYFIDQHIALGHRRLAIIDLSAQAHQPMANLAKNIWLVYNGEMYNFKEERKILEQKGRQFRSDSDTEVVLTMYEEYGDDFLLRMRGMFALALYDKRPGEGREKIMLARDQLGIKPLLYYFFNDRLIFGSELKTILASGLVPKEVEPEALRKLLTFGSVTQPSTMIKNVRMLLPAQRLIFQHNRLRIEKYWHLRAGRYPELPALPYRQQKIFVQKELEKIVCQQMTSDVPIGAFLSGGIDSSLLVAMMSKISKQKVKTFSIGFGSKAKEIDESEEALKIARFLKTDHAKVVISDQEVRAAISQFARALDQPSVDGLNSYFVSKAAKSAVTVAISGTGGDELFAGYPWFANMLHYSRNMSRDFDGVISELFSQEIFDPLMKTRAKAYLTKLRDQGFFGEFIKQYQIFGPILTLDLLSRAFKQESSIGCAPTIDLASSDELPYANPVDRVTGLCLKGYTQNQLLRDIDATSMSHSLEVRVPFLDPILTDIALSLPIKSKLAPRVSLSGQAENQTYRDLGSKKILIDIGRDLLPKNMARQKKRGFALPFDHWLKGSLKDVLEDALSSESVKRRGFFEPLAVVNHLKNYLKGESNWPFVWLLMITELWSREILDGK